MVLTKSPWKSDGGSICRILVMMPNLPVGEFVFVFKLENAIADSDGKMQRLHVCVTIESALNEKHPKLFQTISMEHVDQ